MIPTEEVGVRAEEPENCQFSDAQIVVEAAAMPIVSPVRVTGLVTARLV